jgi:putative membrane protein
VIHYDPHKWLDHFFDIRGSLVREISVRVAVCVAWAGIVAYAHSQHFKVSIPPAIHGLVGTALGLLLVFRTNASYDRFWEGRKLWGGIVNETRNLARSASVLLAADRELLHRVTRWTVIFPYAAMNILRGAKGLGPVGAPEEITGSQHAALSVSAKITECLNEARSKGLISDIVFTSIDQNVQLLVDYLGGCERIRKTPLPFAYVVHLRRALFLYCMTVPFALVEQTGWVTIAETLLISYVFFGIEEIGVEIEGPFGYDENDLPLEDICETIHRNLFALAGIGQQDVETLPEGL